MISTFKHVTVGLQELGVSEAVGSAENPRIHVYFSATTYPANQVTDSGTPWCAAFVCWCLSQAGIKHPNSAWSLSFLKWGQAIKDPQFGAICVLSRTNDPNLGHVGFVLGWDTEWVYLLSGNTRNQVIVDRFERKKVLGFRLPPSA